MFLPRVRASYPGNPPTRIDQPMVRNGRGKRTLNAIFPVLLPRIRMFDSRMSIHQRDTAKRHTDRQASTNALDDG